MSHFVLQEISKDVTTLSSSIYGHRVASAYDVPQRQFNRVNLIQTDFYRRNDVNIDAPGGVKLLPH